MANPDWGLKRICPNCGTRYYDFGRSPPTCPNCSTQYDPEALLRSRRTRPGAVVDEPVRKVAAVPKEDADILDDEVAEDAPDAVELDEDAEDTADDTLIVDADEIDDGEIEVIEVEDMDDNE